MVPEGPAQEGPAQDRGAQEGRAPGIADACGAEGTLAQRDKTSGGRTEHRAGLVRLLGKCQHRPWRQDLSQVWEGSAGLRAALPGWCDCAGGGFAAPPGSFLNSHPRLLAAAQKRCCPNPRPGPQASRPGVTGHPCALPPWKPTSASFPAVPLLPPPRHTHPPLLPSTLPSFLPQPGISQKLTRG